MDGCSTTSGSLEGYETVLEDQSFPRDVLDCSKELLGKQPQPNAKVVPSRFSILSKNLAPPASA
jgi:hypothetical protein